MIVLSVTKTIKNIKCGHFDSVWKLEPMWKLMRPHTLLAANAKTFKLTFFVSLIADTFQSRYNKMNHVMMLHKWL